MLSGSHPYPLGPPASPPNLSTCISLSEGFSCKLCPRTCPCPTAGWTCQGIRGPWEQPTTSKWWSWHRNNPRPKPCRWDNSEAYPTPSPSVLQWDPASVAITITCWIRCLGSLPSLPCFLTALTWDPLSNKRFAPEPSSQYLLLEGPKLRHIII